MNREQGEWEKKEKIAFGALADPGGRTRRPPPHLTAARTYDFFMPKTPFFLIFFLARDSF